MSILPCMKCKHSLGSDAPNLFCEKFHAVVDHRGGCGVGEPIVITNADRIRAMSDAELAKWLNDMQGYSFSCGLIEARISEYPNRYNAWLEWLKEEAGETDG